MASVVERTGDDGVLRLADIQDLRDYCYIVAGIVGELLTDHMGAAELTAVFPGHRFARRHDLV